MSIKQFTKGPLHLLSHPCQSLKWFSVVDEESRIDTRNKAGGVTRGKDAAAEFSVDVPSKPKARTRQYGTGQMRT